MKITLLKNMTGLIHGGNPRRIGCDREGTLRIGNTVIQVAADTVMPLLFYGGTGDYPASFADLEGRVYDLGKVEVRAGRIDAPPDITVEILELKCRADAAEDECESLREQVRELGNIFDTNSLNFLIK